MFKYRKLSLDLGFYNYFDKHWHTFKNKFHIKNDSYCRIAAQITFILSCSVKKSLNSMCWSNTVTSPSPQISKLKEKINIDLLLLFLVGRYGIYLRSSFSNIDLSMCMSSLEKIIPVGPELYKWHCDVVHGLKHNACDQI